MSMSFEEREELIRLMPEKMRRFVEEWLSGANTGKPFNGRAAYEYAGYKIPESNPSANASKLLRHPKVQAYLEAVREEHAMSAHELISRMTDIARADLGDIITVDESVPGGRLKLSTEGVVSNRRFIKKFGYDAQGYPKVEFQDPMVAMQNIMRILGLAKDGIELSGPGGAPVAMQVTFVDPQGRQMESLGPSSEDEVTPEDFSEFDDE